MVVLLKFLDDLIHVSWSIFVLNPFYVKITNDIKRSGKEPWKFTRFRDEKRR